MRHQTTREIDTVTLTIDSGVSKTNFTHRNEIFKHIVMTYTAQHMTVTIDRIVYQDKTRNFKRVANLSVEFNIVAYKRINAANGMPENVPAQRIYKRFTTLVALQVYMLDLIQLINEKMSIGIR
jgi:hypothetical protein